MRLPTWLPFDARAPPPLLTLLEPGVLLVAAALVLVINVVLVVQFVVGHFDSPPAYAASVLLGVLYLYAVSLTVPDAVAAVFGGRRARVSVDEAADDLANPLLVAQ